MVIANDITVQIGSFGTKDDLLFQRASELARFSTLIMVNKGHCTVEVLHILDTVLRLVTSMVMG